MEMEPFVIVNTVDVSNVSNDSKSIELENIDSPDNAAGRQRHTSKFKKVLSQLKLGKTRVRSESVKVRFGDCLHEKKELIQKLWLESCFLRLFSSMSTSYIAKIVLSFYV